MRLSLFIWTTAEGKPPLLMCNVLHTSLIMTPHSGTSFFILKPWKQRVSILRACEYIDVDWKVRFLWCRVLGCVCMKSHRCSNR